MSPKKLQQGKGLLLWGIASLLAFGLSHSWTPMVYAQLPNLNLDQSSNQQPSIQYVQRGNIHIAKVYLDGVSLFQVAAPAARADDSDNRRNILPIEWRVNEIETQLAKLVRSGFDPDVLQVKVKTLNNQTVIVATDQDWQQALMTVTEQDRQIDHTSNALSEIAKIRAEQIKAALLKANRERQPEYLWQQLFYLLIILSVVIISSLIMLRLQRWLKQRWLKLNQISTEEPSSEPTNTNVVEQPQYTSSEWTPSLPPQQARLPQFSLTKQRNINLTLRSLLWWGQITIWLGGSILALLLFPQTRGVGIWLIGVPFNFIVILLGLSVAKKIIDNLVVFGSHQWAEHDALRNTSEQRVALRIPTIIHVVQEVTLYIVISVGVLMFLYAIQAPLTLVLTGVGIVGFTAQNLIKDWIGGVLILWEDQYTLGDVVKINDTAGLVEYISLRITQLRNLQGELITIANGSFTTAINLTHKWSQINLGIDVAYSTDLDQAIMVIKDVAVKMCHDPSWEEYIREPPTILGVDAFGDNSITIRLLIKTQPMKQWDVGREYRRRLKKAFDLANITIPFPQRSIWFEGGSMDTHS